MIRSRFVPFLAGCLAALAAACTADNEFDAPFVTVERPRPVEVACTSLPCDVPGAVTGFVVDSSYVFYTMLHPAHRFVVCDLPTMTPVAELMRVGRGPDEFDYLQFDKRPVRDGEGCGFRFYAARQHLSARLNLTRSRREGRLCIDRRSVVDESALNDRIGAPGQLFGFLQTSDSTALYQVLRMPCVAKGIYDFKNDTILCRLDFDARSESTPNLTGGPVAVHPDGDRIVMLPSFFDQINLCRIDGSGRKSVSTRRHPLTAEQVERFAAEERHIYYSDVAVTDSRIVALYRNEDSDAVELHVFDWTGNLLHLLLPDCAMTAVSLDAATGTLYGFVSSQCVARLDMRRWL